VTLQRSALHLTFILLSGCGSSSTSKAPDRAPPLSAYQPTALSQQSPAPANEAAKKLAWPRTFQGAGKTFAIHQPQIIAWDGDQISARSAVVVSDKTAKEAQYGAIWIEARTDVDKPARVVTLNELKITKAVFPQDKSAETVYLEAIRTRVGDATRVVALDQLEANLAANESARAAAVEIKNDPPLIIFATKPTLLVLIDGEPAPREVKGSAGTKLMRVVNTRALVLLDESTGRYYLHAMQRWVSAPSALGPWEDAKNAPAELEVVKASLKDDKSVDLLNPSDPTTAPKQMPAVLSSTTPAELIQTTGEPQYERVPGTNLMFASNTDSALFKHTLTQQHYVLVSGRWFASSDLKSPWAYVPGKELPADFMKIPPDGPKANVLVSVPGTPQAHEAAIANSIPQTAAVKISEAKLTVTYDGAPKFAALAGTKGLMYATNCALPVIRLDSDQTCWCVENGVWFTAKAPTGPWVVATSVPGIIYTIPASNPLHYVTYVRVYGIGPDVVYVGYTPGYFGTCVTPDGVVVYGTGYSYPAYVGTVWVGYPPTYGYGAGFSYGSSSGFAFGFTAGVMIGGCWGSPYWGPCYGHGYSNIDINSSNVYTNRRGGVTTVNRHYEYDAWTGKGESRGSFSSYNPYSNRTSVGGYEGKFDRYSGEYNMKRGAATYDADTGIARAAGSKVSGDVDNGTQTVKRGGASYNENTGVVKGAGSKTKYDAEDGTIDRETGKFRYNTNTDTGIARKGDEVYVGRDDEVYRHTDEGWQHKTDDGWQDAERDPNRSGQTRELDQQRQSRQTGSQRVNNYQSAGAYQSNNSSRSSAPSRSTSSGGARRGGGGGGRR
jgi:hypothetical protein